MKTLLFLLLSLSAFAETGENANKLSELTNFTFSDSYGKILTEYENSQYKLTQLGDEYLILKNYKITNDSLNVSKMSLRFKDGYLNFIYLEFTGKDAENAKKIKKILASNKDNFQRSKKAIVCSDYGAVFDEKGKSQIISIVDINQ